jgi:hypothetical protein
LMGVCAIIAIALGLPKIKAVGRKEFSKGA